VYSADSTFLAEDADTVEVAGHWSFRWSKYGPSLALVLDEVGLVGPGKNATRILRDTLEEAGAFVKRLPLPATPSRIAVVSSRSSEGSRDFLTRLASQAVSATVFEVDLLSREAVARAIRQAATKPEAFDLVAIVRGGGLQGPDLAVWSSSEVASAIVDRTVPVITGIGHSADQTLADELADRSFITPTDAADWVLRQQAAQVAEREAQEREMREAALRRARLFAWIVALTAAAIATLVLVHR
jgi:exodeoxyribonuclease VII large subunit